MVEEVYKVQPRGLTLESISKPHLKKKFQLSKFKKTCLIDPYIDRKVVDLDMRGCTLLKIIFLHFDGFN